MGFFDFIGGQISNGFNAMNNMMTEKIADLYYQYRIMSNSELQDIIENSEQTYIKIAIIFAMSDSSIDLAIEFAKRYNLSKRTFEKYTSNRRLVRPATEILKMYDEY